MKEEEAEEEPTTDRERGEETEGEPVTLDQNEKEEQQWNSEAVIREVKAVGAGEEPQQALMSPANTPRHASPHILSSPMEAVVEVHVEEADLDAL